jgi:very-short-patch-repair endonuclease
MWTTKWSCDVDCHDAVVPTRPFVPRELRVLPFRGRDAIEAGLLTWSALRGLTWLRLLPGIYVHVGTPLDHRMWCRAAVLWATDGIGGGVAVGGHSAAYLWGAADGPDDGRVELVIPRRSRRGAPDRIRLVRCALGVRDIVALADIPVTSPERTAFDIARRWDRIDAVVTIDAMLGRYVLTLDDHRAYADAHRGWPGAAAARLIIPLLEPRTESLMESRVRLVIVDGGLPRPVAQFEVRDSIGRFIGRVDLAYPQWRIAIEYDGDHHRGREEYRDDQRRANALRVAGWTVLRFTASDLWRRPDQIVAHIARSFRHDFS